MAFKFPWTNYHELNLDWILKKLGELFEASAENVETIESYEGRLTTVESDVVTIGGTADQALQIATAAQTDVVQAQQTATQALGLAQTAQSTAAGAINASGTAISESQLARQEAQQAIYIAQNTAGQLDGQVAALQAESERQQQAIEDKGDEVRASIPSDYTVMSQEVYDLSSKILVGENILDTSKITNDMYIAPSSGALIQYTGWSTSDFMPIVEGESYVLVNMLTSQIANVYIGFYDADKTYITGTGGGKSVFTAPTGSKYLRVSQATTYFNSPTIMVVNKTLFDNGLESYIPYTLDLYKAKSEYGIAQNAQDIKLNYWNDANVKSISRLGYRKNGGMEQTLYAYKQAVIKGYKVLLCDLRFTSDDVPVCLHDASINRTAVNLDGTAISTTINISDITYEDTLNYDFGLKAGAAFSSIGILKLDDMVKFCKQTGCSLYIESKVGATDANKLSIALDVVRKNGMEKNTSWVSTTKTEMLTIVTGLDTARVGLMPLELTAGNKSNLIALQTGKNDVFWFGWNTHVITDDELTWLLSHNIKCEIGTINTNADLIAFFSGNNYYVSGVESDSLVANHELRNAAIS